MMSRILSGLSRLLAVVITVAVGFKMSVSRAQNYSPYVTFGATSVPGTSQKATMFPSGDQLDDWDLVGRVRAALFADPELAQHNLIVVVRGGIVELDGPVPSASLRDRVLQVVRSVPGVRQLRERLRIQVDSWSGRPSCRRLPPVDEPRPSDAKTVMASPVSPPLATFSTLHAAHSRTDSAPPPEAIFRPPTLLPPQVDTAASAPAVWPHSSLQAASTQLFLEEYVRRQWRYRQVQLVLQGTTLVLTGTVESVEDRRELLQLVSQLPGVRAIRADGLRVQSGLSNQ